jgi:hypothetical protein
LSPPGSSPRYDSIRCYASGQFEAAIQAEHIFGPPDDLWDRKPALLRLAEAPPGQALKLNLASPRPGQNLLVMHYPLGQPRAQLSLGRLLGVEGPWLRHDADTEGGSGGGAVLDGDTQTIVGMHFRASLKKRLNEALSLASMLEDLRASPVWGEIADHHRLADVGGALQALDVGGERRVETPKDTDLVAAAVRWSFDPERLPPETRERLRPLAGDPSAPRWSLQASERKRLIRSAGSLEALRQARGDGRRERDDLGQQAIDQILDGPPYRLDDLDEASLPYWLQAVRWFAGVVPSLPTPAEVNRNLERRRVRSRLLRIAGPGFRGRQAEIDQLQSWYQDETAGPKLVTGIGGIGKSALVAQFALGLPPSTLLLWLDFDRADLAPDDAVSVLGSLAEQVSVQHDGFVPPEPDISSWEDSVDDFGAELRRALPAAAAPLLVLDGFEVAQHVRRHQEIWRVLEALLEEVPRMRVLISGRAPIGDLELGGRMADSLPLTGLAPEDAKAWLAERGVTDVVVLERVLEISRGVPLVLKLALRLIDTGTEVPDLPAELPEALVEGFLYQRILDRVMDRALKPLARDALVLRSLTEEMLPVLLHDSIPVGLDPPEVFSRLSREMGLVENLDLNAPGGPGPAIALAGGLDELRLRPEVRTATLRLLELDDPVRVREIDRRAAAWYAGQDQADDANVAELVYHRLRLGDIEGAKLAWRADCAPLLLYAVDDLPETAHAARAWLRARTVDARAAPEGLEAWENQAMVRIRAAIGRGLLRAVPQILGERQGRSPASPLAFYDAWARWRAGDLPGARSTLATAQRTGGPIGRDRAVLGAAMAREAGEPAEADRLLAAVEDESQWADTVDGPLAALAVSAARVRLTVDLRAELELSDILAKPGDDGNDVLLTTLRGFLVPADLVLPSLSDRLEERVEQEEVRFTLAIPTSVEELGPFGQTLETERQLQLSGPIPEALRLDVDAARAGVDDGWKASDLGLHPSAVAPTLQGPLTGGTQRGLDLAVLGRRRWRIASTSLFLAQACAQATGADPLPDPMSLAVAGTLAAFRGQGLMFASGEVSFPARDLDGVLERAMEGSQRAPQPPPAAARRSLARQVLDHEPGGGPEIAESITAWLKKPTWGIPPWAKLLPSLGRRTGLKALVLYLLGPDPLEMLYRRAAGLPDSLDA